MSQRLTLEIPDSLFHALEAEAMANGKTLEQLALECVTRQAVVDTDSAELQRHRFFDELNAGFAALRVDPQAWLEELEERAAWDATLLDGLEDD